MKSATTTVDIAKVVYDLCEANGVQPAHVAWRILESDRLRSRATEAEAARVLIAALHERIRLRVAFPRPSLSPEVPNADAIAAALDRAAEADREVQRALAILESVVGREYEP
jgi:hypothetical protein